MLNYFAAPFKFTVTKPINLNALCIIFSYIKHGRGHLILLHFTVVVVGKELKHLVHKQYFLACSHHIQFINSKYVIPQYEMTVGQMDEGSLISQK